MTMTTLQPFTLFFNILLLALVAGLFYGYSCSVNPGLGALGDAEYIKAMQSINVSIQNPVFFLSFMGSLIIVPVTAWIFYSQPLTARFYCLLASAIIYIVGVFVVTMVFNVPLNNALAQFQSGEATAQEIATQRLNFEIPWNRFHFIRTIAAIISLGLSIIASIIR